MKGSHAGMKITDMEFNALVEDLVKSLDKFKVGAPEKTDLLSALGGMKGDIVNQ
jgi:hemoglobin